MGGVESSDDRQRLVTLVRHASDAGECWQHAEAFLRAGELRDRLEQLGVTPTPDIAVSLMAASMMLASMSEEWGGDYRDALGDLATMGLELFDG